MWKNEHERSEDVLIDLVDLVDVVQREEKDREVDKKDFRRVNDIFRVNHQLNEVVVGQIQILRFEFLILKDGSLIKVLEDTLDYKKGVD